MIDSTTVTSNSEAPKIGREAPFPGIFRIRTAADLDRIPFVDGMAAVELPAALIDAVGWKNDHRGDSPRLRALANSIRRNGYQPLEPITARVGRKGRWVVVNGGHRLTAARQVIGEFWANLFGPKVTSLYIVLFLNPDSWSRTEAPDGVALPDRWREDEKGAWERAQERMRKLRG